MPKQDTEVKTEGDAASQQDSKAGVLDGTASSSAAAEDLDDSSPSTMVWWAFMQLLQEKYIERAPPCNLPPLPPKSHAPVRAKKAAPKPGQ
jgi:hypothetical protein